MPLNCLKTGAAKKNNPTFVELLGRALCCTSKNMQVLKLSKTCTEAAEQSCKISGVGFGDIIENIEM